MFEGVLVADMIINVPTKPIGCAVAIAELLGGYHAAISEGGAHPVVQVRDL